jgi:hypothetical protein
VVSETPVLLLGYNRPEQMRGLIQSLASLEPKLILLAVDGPRNNRPNDAELVRQTQDLVSKITWDAEIRTRFRDSNLGLRRAVVDAVTWANSEYGRVIVLEDDVRTGPQLIEFLDRNLIRYQESSQIAHINGYNLVPKEHLTHPDNASRLTIYPESYAWATWDRAWQKYDDDMTWAKNASLSDIKKICGSTIGALRWKQNFSDASAERIDSWAYRWLASMWANNLKIVSSNRNISQYKGFEGGTHTRRQMKWSELEIEQLPTSEGKISNIGIDKLADRWLARNIFKSTTLGIIEGKIVSIVLTIIKKVKSK